MNALKSMTGIVVAVTVAAGSGCAGDPSGPSSRERVFFIGTVTSTRGLDRYPDLDLDGRIAAGQTVVGSYMYDRSAVDLNSSHNAGTYLYTTPPYGISVTVNGFTFETDPTNVDFAVLLTDNGLGQYNFGHDFYEVSNWNSRIRTDGPEDVSYVDVRQIFWRLRDTTGTALSGTVLPSSAPDLADWQSNDLQVGGGGWEVRIHITQAIGVF